MPSYKLKPAHLFGLGALLALLAPLLIQQRRRIEFKDRVVVITGGSRGLGLLLAKRLAQEGARLVLLARDGDELERAKLKLAGYGFGVLALVCDVRNQLQVENALQQVIDRWGRIDVLINNAGIIQVGPLEHMNLEDYQAALEVHFWGPLYTMLAVLPSMRQQGGGRIVNIASIGGEVAIPHLAPYVASKYALVGLSDTFRAELGKDGIYVTTVVPGLMRTGSHVNALFKGNHRAEYTWFSILGALPVASTDAEKAANEIIAALAVAKPYHVITFQARGLMRLYNLFPGMMGAVMRLSNRLLPKYNPTQGYISRKGLESQTKISPSFLTVLSDQAAERNNQLPGPGPVSIYKEMGGNADR
jgi:NAD(P)-dependent dehydrogenase (short-subunit alcohol dehydrogenase family)